MLRATRGMWRTPRQILRANKNKKSSTPSSSSSADSGNSTGSASGARRTLHDAAKQESIVANHQRHHKHSFGRMKMDMIPKVMVAGAVEALNVGAVDALAISLKDLAEDDDGR
ncbi:hypothetical protein FI667_g316, partial [Globisporangium splendens]